MKKVLLDTNFLLRFITGEPEKQAVATKKLMLRAESDDICVIIVPLIVAEAVFVLTGRVYGFSPESVRDALTLFLESPAIEVLEREVLITALRNFAEKKVDFVDAYLAASAHAGNYELASFDQDFRKFENLKLINIDQK